MKTSNGDMPSMPIVHSSGRPFHESNISLDDKSLCIGLSKREQFAMAAMQGMLAHATRYKPREGASENWHEAISEESVQLADALLAELDKAGGE